MAQQTPSRIHSGEAFVTKEKTLSAHDSHPDSGYWTANSPRFMFDSEGEQDEPHCGQATTSQTAYSRRRERFSRQTSNPATGHWDLRNSKIYQRRRSVSDPCGVFHIPINFEEGENSCPASPIFNKEAETSFASNTSVTSAASFDTNIRPITNFCVMTVQKKDAATQTRRLGQPICLDNITHNDNAERASHNEVISASSSNHPIVGVVAPNNNINNNDHHDIANIIGAGLRNLGDQWQQQQDQLQMVQLGPFQLAHEYENAFTMLANMWPLPGVLMQIGEVIMETLFR